MTLLPDRHWYDVVLEAMLFDGIILVYSMKNGICTHFPAVLAVNCCSFTSNVIFSNWYLH